MIIKTWDFSHQFLFIEFGFVFLQDDDQSLQKALQNCLLAMRQRGSNVFDVPTAVSRPIQRCLKYPLYVGEILKVNKKILILNLFFGQFLQNTPIHHPDHPKLMEALRQLGNLASRMNECKRRKELSGFLFVFFLNRFLIRKHPTMGKIISTVLDSGHLTIFKIIYIFLSLFQIKENKLPFIFKTSDFSCLIFLIRVDARIFCLGGLNFGDR